MISNHWYPSAPWYFRLASATILASSKVLTLSVVSTVQGYLPAVRSWLNTSDTWKPRRIYIYYNGYWDILGYIHGNYEHIWILIGILIGKYWDINGYYYILLHTIVVIDNEEHVLMIMTDNYYCYYSYDWEYHSYLLYKCATDDFYHSFGSRCLWKILSFGSQAAVRRFHQQATQ